MSHQPIQIYNLQELRLIAGNFKESNSKLDHVEHCGSTKIRIHLETSKWTTTVLFKYR